MAQVLCCLALLLLSGLSALAQGPPVQRRPAEAREQSLGPDPAGPNLRGQGEVVRMLDDWAVQQARRALQLDEPTYTRLAPRMRQLHEVRRRNQQQRNRLLQDLRRLAGPRAPDRVDEDQIRERLHALREHDRQAAAELRAAYEALDELLTPRQQARFRILEETLENRKLDLLLRARQRAGRGAVDR